jgi:hypothetical protein
MIKVTTPKKGAGATKVTFVLPADVHDGPVSVVGCFNDWTPGVDTLVKRSNGTRSASVELEDGVYEFRYLGAGGVWLDEPTAPARSGDNALLVLPA